VPLELDLVKRVDRYLSMEHYWRSELILTLFLICRRFRLLLKRHPTSLFPMLSGRA
jgi:hypothetical protein